MSPEAQHILDSGDLELFALDVLESDRRRQIQEILARDASLRAELLHIQQSLEDYARAHASAAPAQLRTRILSAAINAEHTQDAQLRKSSDRSSGAEKSEIIPSTTPMVRRVYAIAAMAAFVCSTALAVYFYRAYTVLSSSFEEAQSELASLRSQSKVFAAKLEVQDTRISLLQNRETLSIQLAAQTGAPPHASSVVLWNRQTHEVYLDASALASADPNHDYQLWALVQGKPVDLGVFLSGDGSTLTKMKSIELPDAFAVTLEPKGGSQVPTLTQLCLMAKVSS